MISRARPIIKYRLYSMYDISLRVINIPSDIFKVRSRPSEIMLTTSREREENRNDVKP